MARSTTYTRNLAAEQDAQRALLESGAKGGAYQGAVGADITKVSSATQKLMQEQINMRVYGTANPTFSSTTASISPEQKATTVPSQEQLEEEAPVTPRPELTYDSEDETSSYTEPTEPTAPTAVKSLEDLRTEALARIQSTIDATEAIYQSDLARLQKQAEASSARTSSIAVSHGLAGSPFQETMERRTEESNEAIIQARERERAAEIASIQASAEDESQQNYQLEMQRYQQERSEYETERERYTAEQKAKTDAQRTKATSVLTNAAKAGYSISEIDQDSYQKLLEDAGMSDFEAQTWFALNSPSAGAKYEMSNGKLIGYYIDPKTGKPVISTTDIPGFETASGTYDAKIVGNSLVFIPDNVTDPSQIIVQQIGETETETPDVQNFGTSTSPDWRQFNSETSSWDKVGGLDVTNQDTSIQSNAQLELVNSAISNAEKYADAAGRSTWREAIAEGLFGATKLTNLRAYANTIKTTLLTLAADPNIKKFFGPQMSEADVRMMMAGGTTLDPDAQGPEEFREELTRVKELITRIQGSVSQSGITSEEDLKTLYEQSGISDMNFEDAVKTYGEDQLKQILGFNNDLNTSLKGSELPQVITQSFKGGEKGGQCGHFVNQLTGLKMGDSLSSKLSYVDSSIKVPNSGDVFVMNYKDTGHTGIILDAIPKNNGTYDLNVVDSNYGLDEKVKYHTINSSKILGYARV